MHKICNFAKSYKRRSFASGEQRESGGQICIEIHNTHQFATFFTRNFVGGGEGEAVERAKCHARICGSQTCIHQLVRSKNISVDIGGAIFLVKMAESKNLH